MTLVKGKSMFLSHLEHLTLFHGHLKYVTSTKESYFKKTSTDY